MVKCKPKDPVTLWGPGTPLFDNQGREITVERKSNYLMREIDECLRMIEELRRIGRRVFLSRAKRKRKTRPLTAEELDLLQRAKREPVEVMKDKLFTKPGFEKEVSALFRELDERTVPQYVFLPEDDDAGQSEDNLLARKFVRKHEQEMFRGYNYCRFRLFDLTKGLNGEVPPLAQARKITFWFQRMVRIREFIAAANMPLVMTMIGYSKYPITDIQETISAGNEALFRAINKFEANRGNKFSTYACRAIISQINRDAGKVARCQSKIVPTEDMESLSPQIVAFRDKVRDQQCATCLEVLGEAVTSANLTENERLLIGHRFKDGMTFAELGEKLGFSTERARQVLDSALGKIRKAFEDCHNLPAMQRI